MGKRRWFVKKGDEDPSAFTRIATCSAPMAVFTAGEDSGSPPAWVLPPSFSPQASTLSCVLLFLDTLFLLTYPDPVRKRIPVDQHTLQTGDPVKVQMAARYYIEKLGSFGGGIVAGYYGSNAAIGGGPELQAVACRAFMKNGDPAPKWQVIG